MFEGKEQKLPSYFTRLNPAYRFEQVSETIINQTHPSSSSSNKDSVKVLSWNIARNNYHSSWSRNFLAIVQQYQPDKIFLQEVRLDIIVREIPELAQMSWSFVPNFIDKFNNTYSGILIAAKANCIGSKALITKHYEPVSKTPKASLFAEYSLFERSESLLAVNTHLINFVGLNKFKAQLQEIESILSRHQGAIIFAGDFNTWNSYRWIILCQMAARLNLTSVSFTPEDTKKIKSFLLSPPLDYIFYRGFRQKPDTAKVIDNIYSSDHNPLLVELCLENN